METKNPFALWLGYTVVFRPKLASKSLRYKARVLQCDGVWVKLEFLGGHQDRRFSSYYEIVEVHV
jgi:hypothetical protein